MVKFKKILSVLTVCVMGASAFAGCAPAADGSEKADSYESQELKILQSDVKIPPEELLSLRKAEYLIENQGYKEDDEVVAILSLGDALIDEYLADSELSDKISLAEYAASPAGKALQGTIGFEQSDLIRRLQSEGLIKSVEYRYNTVANALAVTMTYGNFLKLEKAGLCESVSLSETYSHPLEAERTDASTIENLVDVYETGIFNGESAKDKNGDFYTGKGTSVAVLDSGFELSHQVFNTHKVEGELMYSEAYVDGKVKARAADGTPALNAAETTRGLVVSDVYYSDKIPFQYDYADGDPDVSPYDSEHGTHVAGIIGGYADSYIDKEKNTPTDENGDPIPFRGIAPDTQLVLMKVFSDLSAGAETPDILAALEDAVVLGVDAINMSLGSACGFTRERDEDLVNKVYDSINASGTSLIIAAGNNYSSGYGGEQGNTNRVTNPESGTIGSPSSYAASLSVASISGNKSKYLVSDKGQVFFFYESNSIAGEENDFYGELYEDMGWERNDVEHTMEYVTVPGYGTRANFTTVKVKGKIALISRGDNTFEDKALQAKNAGAAACIIYNNVEGDIRMSMGKSDHIPTISISKEDGVALASVSEGTITFSYKQEAGPFMSDFSSWGPLPDLTLKPEITAHGGNITSSFPGSTFGTISGTSMACPNLCGIVILIRQYIKDNYEMLTGEQETEDDSYMLNIKNLTNKLLMSTATIVLNEQGIPYSPRKQGAGLASLYNVVNTRAYLQVEKDGKVQERAKLELGDDAKRTGVYEMYFDVVNISTSPAVYEAGIIGMTESVSTADADFVAERDQLLGDDITVEALGEGGSVSGKTVTVNAKSTLKLKLTYTLTEENKQLIDDLFPYGMYVEGFVTLAAKEDADIDLNIPFLAFYGDWTQAPIFDKTYYEVETEAHNAGIDEDDKIKADYCATTPYGAYWFNYIIPLGTYINSIDESIYSPIPATEDRIAISDTLGTIDGILTVREGLLRGCSTMTYTITDKTTGEEIFHHVDYNARKAFSQGGSPIPGYDEKFEFMSSQYDLVNNRKYQFNMEGLLDYGDGGVAKNARNSFTFDFTFDTESPIIRSATYEKEYDRTQKKDRYYVNLVVYDNCYAMSIEPGLFVPNPDYDEGVTNAFQFRTLSPTVIPLYGERGEDYTVRIEITDYLDDLKYNVIDPETGMYLQNSICFLVEDYALNQNLFVCQLPGTSGEFSFTSDGTATGSRLNLKSIGINEVLDLTPFLNTADTTLDPDRDYLKYLEWISSNPSVATVEYGQVRGISAGRTDITVVERMTGNYATISVQVIDKSTAATAASVGTENVVSPLAVENVEDATSASIKELRFSYFDTLFAHALAGQTSYIGSTGDRVFLTAYQGGISLYPGETIGLQYDVKPWYVKDNYKFVYRSDREDVATVTEAGVVRALKKGNATITLRVYNKEGTEIVSNLIATLRITVNSEFVIDEARTLVAYKGLGGKVVIPDDEGILYVGPYSFSLYERNLRYAQKLPEDNIYDNYIPQSNTSITSVVVPAGVMEIQQNAFYHCTGLKEVTLPESLQFIRQNAFTGDTALEKINLTDVESIGISAFEGCTSLKDFGAGEAAEGKPIVIPAYAVGRRAFYGCTSLIDVDLTYIRNMGSSAFMGCTKLANVKLGPLTKLSEHIFDGCGLTSVECYESNILPAYAFANNKLTSMKLLSEQGLDSIGDYAFANNPSLAEIMLPNSSFVLGENVFEGCTGLAKIILQGKTQITAAQGSLLAGSGVTSFEIKQGDTNPNYTVADGGKQLVSGSEIILAAINAYSGALNIDAAITKIGASAFSGAPITSVTFGSAVTLGEYAFANCKSLASVTFADAANTVGNYAFYGCSALTKAENLTKTATVGNYAFANSALGEVVLGAVTLGEGAFNGTPLTAVTLGEGAKIGASAFKDCTSLQTVTLGGGNVTVGASAFSGNYKLAAIDLSKVAGEIGDEAFFGCRVLPRADLSNVTKLGVRAFANCMSLASVTLGQSLTAIGEGAFMDLAHYLSSAANLGPSFTAITLPASLETLGNYAFYGCRRLASVELPAKIAAVPEGAFGMCTSLASVSLPEGCLSVGDAAFRGCAALNAIGLGKVQTFGREAFAQAGLTSADLGSALTIADSAFAQTPLTGTITAPELTSVGALAFDGAKFTTLTAPKLATIGNGAFRNALSLNAFSFGASLESVGDYAFLGCTAISEFTFGTENAKDGKINGYAKLVDGVLYTTMKNGMQKLTSVPAGKIFNGGSFIVEEGTTYIGYYAGSENKSLTSLILPDSLDVIGEYAFYRCTNLRSVEFRSATAPALENSNSGSVRLLETDPGYDLLHDQFSLYGEQSYYFNFKDLVGRNEPLKMILPANTNASGYDNIIYRVYFGTVEKAQRSEYVAMEQSMKDFLRLGKAVAAIPFETITLNNEAVISQAMVALNAIKQDPSAYGVGEEEWNALTEAVTAARDRIARLKVEYAKKSVRDLQARIDALPAEYENTEAINNLILALQADIQSLEIDDRNLLIQDKYTAFLAAYEAAHTETPPAPPTVNGDEFPAWAWAIIGVGIALVVIGAAVAVVLFLRKKQKPAAPAEEAPLASEAPAAQEPTEGPAAPQEEPEAPENGSDEDRPE